VSAAFGPIPPAPAPAEPVLATAVILWRDGPDGREVLLVRRGDERRFAGGFHAFPGGRLDPQDRDLAVPGAAADQAPLLACAARELFEETGVLLARGAERLSREERDAARRALLDDRATFAEILGTHRLALDPGALEPAGRWVTPTFLPLRYDARLFLARLPAGASAEVWPGELAGGAFLPARRALAAWERGEILLHPPNLWGIAGVARDGPPDAAALRAQPYCEDGVSRRIEFQRGVLLAALRTPTLPPATHTNAWLVEVEGGLAVVDPGSPDPAEQARLESLLDELAAEGRPAREIWLTHAHPDHAGGAAALAARRGLPVLAHARAAERLGAPPSRALSDGDLLHGRWLALETPGHAPDHLAFLDERTGALLCGDMVSTLSTIVIDPAEGDMLEYERQLERLRALSPRTLFPGHGPPAPNAPGRLAAYRAHRRDREALVVEALARGGSLEAVTAQAYADTPAAFLPVAARSCLAILEKLSREGRARLFGEEWRAR
jgi:ribonuclease/clavin/mitogillin